MSASQRCSTPSPTRGRWSRTTPSARHRPRRRRRPPSPTPGSKHSRPGQTQATVPAAIEFVDIAGLVKGASQRSLGNQFLANIREVDAVVHVVRCFDDAGHPARHGSGRPARDREVINLELGLADLRGREAGRQDRARGQVGRRAGEDRAQVLEQLKDVLGQEASRPPRGPRRRRPRDLSSFNLLTSKPVLYAANVREDEVAAGNAPRRALVRGGRRWRGRGSRKFSAKVEMELADPPPRTGGFLESLGITARIGLDRVATRPPPARPAELLHRGREGSPRLDHPPGWTAPRRPPASSTPISSAASSGPKPSAMVRLRPGWRMEAEPAEQGLVRSEGQESTSYVMVTSCSSGSTSEVASHKSRVAGAHMRWHFNSSAALLSLAILAPAHLGAQAPQNAAALKGTMPQLQQRARRRCRSPRSGGQQAGDHRQQRPIRAGRPGARHPQVIVRSIGYRPISLVPTSSPTTRSMWTW